MKIRLKELSARELPNQEKAVFDQVIKLVDSGKTQEAFNLANTLSNIAQNLLPDYVLHKLSQISEMSGTGGGAGAAGATFTPGAGEQYAAKKSFKKKSTKLESVLGEIVRELHVKIKSIKK